MWWVSKQLAHHKKGPCIQDNLETMIKIVDDMLYEAKNKGRNQVSPLLHRQ